MISIKEYTDLVKESYCRGDADQEEIFNDPDAIEMIKWDYDHCLRMLKEGALTEDQFKRYAIDTTAYNIELQFG